MGEQVTQGFNALLSNIYGSDATVIVLAFVIAYLITRQKEKVSPDVMKLAIKYFFFVSIGSMVTSIIIRIIEVIK